MLQRENKNNNNNNKNNNQTMQIGIRTIKGSMPFEFQSKPKYLTEKGKKRAKSCNNNDERAKEMQMKVN